MWVHVGTRRGGSLWRSTVPEGPNGMAWHGVAWHGMAWHGMAWHAMACHGMACHGMPWHATANLGLSKRGPAQAGSFMKFNEFCKA